MSKKTSTLTRKIKRRKKEQESKSPAWKGPEVDGVTQSLLSRYLVCKERFRVHAIEGLQADRSFSEMVSAEYGSMWHECEEYHANDEDWIEALKQYCMYLCSKYPTEQEQVNKWYQVCLKQFPIYVDYWSKHPDVKKRTPLLQEQNFNVPYELPSGRVVRLRGRWDSVDLIGTSKNAGIYLQENKTKGRIEEDYIARQLTFDLQTMIYLIALEETKQNTEYDETLPERDPEWLFGKFPIKGVRYNVIRRPLSGGKGSIRPHKATKTKSAETDEEFYNRLQQYFIEDPKYWFMRWKVEITPQDIQNFKDQFLDPCLEEMCLWYDTIIGKEDILTRQPDGTLRWAGLQGFLHYRLPYGIYNPIAEGRGSDVEEYLMTGSTVGLKRVDSLFPELD